MLSAGQWSLRMPYSWISIDEEVTPEQTQEQTFVSLA